MMPEPPGFAQLVRNVAVRSGSLVEVILSIDVDMFCECPGAGSADCADTCVDGTMSDMFVAVSLSQSAETLMQGGGLFSAAYGTARAMRWPILWPQTARSKLMRKAS